VSSAVSSRKGVRKKKMYFELLLQGEGFLQWMLFTSQGAKGLPLYPSDGRGGVDGGRCGWGGGREWLLQCGWDHGEGRVF